MNIEDDVTIVNLYALLAISIGYKLDVGLLVHIGTGSILAILAILVCYNVMIKYQRCWMQEKNRTYYLLVLDMICCIKILYGAYDYWHKQSGNRMANVKRCLGWVCRIAYPTAMCRDYGIAQILTKIGRIEQFFFTDFRYAAYCVPICGILASNKRQIGR